MTEKHETPTVVGDVGELLMELRGEVRAGFPPTPKTWAKLDMLIGAVIELQDTIAALQQYRERFDFTHTHNEERQVMCNWLEYWEREDDKDLESGWYCWCINVTLDGHGKIHWMHGPYETPEAAIDAARGES